MASNHHDSRSPSGPSLPQRPPKLKHTCDACRALKIRCDSKKPTCTRCSSHGLSCNYSVARKVGRPLKESRRQITASGATHSAHVPLQPRLESQPNAGKAGDCAAAGVSSQTQAASPAASSSVSIAGGRRAESSPEELAELSSADECMDFTNDDELMDFAFFDARIKPPCLSEFADFLLDGDLLNAPVSLPIASFQPDNSEYEEWDAASVFRALDIPGPSVAFGTAASEYVPSGATALPCVNPHPMDCFSVTTAMQQRMRSLCEPLRSAASKAYWKSTVTAVNGTCQQLSSILTCSCSAQLDMSFLIAATCLSILEVYQAAISRQSMVFSANLAIMDVQDQLNAMAHRAIPLGLHALETAQSGLLHGTNQADFLMLVSTSINAFSTIVHSFASRYGQPTTGSTQLILAPLFAHLKDRLRDITEDVMGKLTCATGGGGMSSGAGRDGRAGFDQL